MAKQRPGNRPRRAGKGPKNNPPRGGAGQNRPNKGASTGNTGRGTSHKKSSSSVTAPQLGIAFALIAVPLSVAGSVIGYLLHGYGVL